MSGPKHTPYPEWVEEAVRDHYDRIAESLVMAAASRITELAEALKRCDSEAVWDDLVDMWLVPNEVMDEIRAALREAGYNDA